MFEKFSNESIRSIMIATDEARNLKHNSVGTEHMLLGILQFGSIASHALITLGLSVSDVHDQLEKMQTPSSDPIPIGYVIPFTKASAELLKTSFEVAREHKATRVTPVHMLLAIQSIDGGFAQTILTVRSISFVAIRARLLEIYGKENFVNLPLTQDELQDSYQRIVEIYTGLHAKEPRRIWLQARALANETLKRYEEALDDYDNLVESQPEDASFRLQRGRLLYFMKRLDDAKADCDAALNLNPKNLAAFVVRASVEFERKEYDNVITTAHEALKSGDTSSTYSVHQAYNLAMQALLRLHRYEEAIELSTTALKRDLTYELKFLRGAAFFRSCRYEEALSDFIDVHSHSDPLRSEALASCAFVSARQCRYDAAQNFANESLSINGRSTLAHCVLAEVDIAKRRFEEAFDKIATAISIDSRCVMAYKLRALARLKQKDIEMAKPDIQKAIEINPDDLGGTALLGLQRLLEKEYQSAIDLLSSVLESDPWEVPAYCWRAAAYELAGQSEKAMADKKKALQLGYRPDDNGI